MKDRKDAGSGILPICPTTGQICLTWRSPKVKDGDKWGVVGGMIKEGLTPEENALVEINEELGYSGPIELIPALVNHRGDFTYHTFLGIVPEPFSYAPQAEFAWETSCIEWMKFEEALRRASVEPQKFHVGLLKLFREREDLIVDYASSGT